MPKLNLSPIRLFERRWKDCSACDLYQTRQRVVLWRGTCPCDVLFIAEAPGISEDSVGPPGALGRPMIGPAGHLLDHIILRAIPKNVTYAVTNLVCCIPRGEDGKKVHEPDDEYVEACSPRLKEFVELCNPKLLVCVGKLAKDWLEVGYRRSIKFHDRIPMVDITHPAATLRANVTQQGLMVQRSVITIRNAVEEYITEE